MLQPRIQAQTQAYSANTPPSPVVSSRIRSHIRKLSHVAISLVAGILKEKTTPPTKCVDTAA